MHWAQSYLGKPWTVDGFGPTAFHCWGLVWYVYKKHYNVDVPKYLEVTGDQMRAIVRTIKSQKNSTDWAKIPFAIDGCLAGMSSHKSLHHVGVFLKVDGGMILHSCEGKGVVCQPISTIRAHGWSRIDYYLHKSWLTS